MPTEMTRFTRLMAFKLIPQAPIMPITLSTVMTTVPVTTSPVRHEPKKRLVTARTAKNASVSTSRVVETM